MNRLEDLPDVDFELSRVSGQSVDKPVIHDIKQTDWIDHAVDIGHLPRYMLLPSDVMIRKEKKNLVEIRRSRSRSARGSQKTISQMSQGSIYSNNLSK